MVNASLLFLWGAMMKLCLADRLGIYVDTVYANIAQHSGTTLLFTSILYTIQIYADFAGYSLMAIGSGKLLGINLQTNFNRPYFATTVTDFWRRWHISLSTWFRDYIYIPLGGSRCSTGRWIFNTLVVFVVSGLWHGAAYTFLLWGALHGMGLVTERLIYGDRLKSITNSLSIGNIFRWGITFIFINCAWIIFRIDNIDSVGAIFTKIISEPGSLYLDYNTLILAFIAFALVFINDISEERSWNIHILRSKYRVIRYISVVILICYIVAFGVLNGGSFIYFQF